MRRALSLLVMVACVSTAQAFDARIMLPSPVSIALTVGQWMTRDRIETFYLRVEATGRDEQDARDQAFRLAVNQAVGSLLLSESHVRDRELVRHDIINYSSGYVHDFQILQRRPVSGGVTIEIDVWVRRSHLADRLLNQSQANESIPGGKISQQIRSLQAQRGQGDRVWSAVLADFPGRAFDISLRPIVVKIDENRRPRLHISFALAWNNVYLRSLGEAIESINHRPDCQKLFARCTAVSMIHTGSSSAYFDDFSALEIMRREMIQSRPSLLVVIRDSRGHARYRSCHSAKELDHSDWAAWRYLEIDSAVARINNRSRNYDVVLDLTQLGTEDLDRVDISVVRVNQC